MSSRIDFEFDKVIQDKNIELSAGAKSVNIKALSFSTRTFNSLNSQNINTVGELLKRRLIELRLIPNIGKGSIEEIYTKLIKIDDEYFKSLDRLGFSQITLEALHRFEITTVDELSAFDRRNFLSIPYHGKKVYKELNEFLKNTTSSLSEDVTKDSLFLNQSIAILDFDLGRMNELKKLGIQNIKQFCQFDFYSNDLLDNTNKKYYDHIKKGLIQKLDSNYKFRDIADMICGKEILLQKYNKDRYKAIKLRLRGDITLEAAGKITKVTRERVRQLEKKALKKLDKYLPEIHTELLLARMPAHEPMYIELLSIKNNYFDAIEEYLGSNGSFIKTIFGHECCHIQFEEFDKNIILSRKGLSINDVFNEIKNNNLRGEAINNFVSTLGRMDSLKLILKKIEDNKPKSMRGKIKLAIEEIFSKSQDLLTISDLIIIFNKKYDINPQNNQLNDALSNNEFIFLFGKNGWGHEKFFRKLDDRQLNDVGSALIEILILSKSSQRGRVGLLEELKVKSKNKRLSELVDRLAPHDIDWILTKINKNHPKLQSLARGNWIWSNKSQDRITMSHAALKVLEDAGKPLKTNELEKKVVALRGSTNQQFQVRTNRNRPELIQLEKETHGQGNYTMWGLRDRDLPISKEKETMLFELICKKLNEGVKYIELNDLEEMIKKCNFDEKISTLQVIRMLFVYTSNANKDNEFFSINFGRQRIPVQGIFKLENRIKFSHKDF